MQNQDSQKESKQIILPWDSGRATRNYRIRKLKNSIIKILAIIAVLLVLYPLVDVLYLFAYRGLQVTTLAVLTQTTTTGSGLVGGGLANAIVGTLVILGISAGITIPLGVVSGVYLAEFAGEKSKFASGIRFVIDVLAAVPSIVLGYVGYLLLVYYLGWGFSAMAAGVTISVMMLPYIMRTTELAIRRVPNGIREGAIALGSTKTSMINRLTLKFALPGVLTGILLAVSISFSETAPYLYTGSFSNYLPTQLFKEPIGYLTYVVWTFSQLPTTQAHNLAYSASFVLIAFVVIVNFVARVVLKRFSKI